MRASSSTTTQKKSKKEKPPKGFAQLPDWWMEITPHDTLDVEEDAMKRKHQSQEAMMYRNLAAKSDWEQANGGIDHPLYTLGKNGELIEKETGKVIAESTTSESAGSSSSPAYTRDEKTGEWLKDGQPIFGTNTSRQFNNNTGKGGPEYGHKDVNWKKPDWMKVKLKGTGKGDTIRKGDYTQFEGKISGASPST